MNTQSAKQKIGPRDEDSDFRIILDSDFKKKLFEKLFTVHSSLNCSKILNISRGMLYHYKNNRVESVPLRMINQIVSLTSIEQEELNKNITRILSSKQVRDFGLDLGRATRKNQLKSFRDEIPSIKDIIENNTLNVEKWFFYYKKLIDFGSRQFQSIVRSEEFLELTYTNYANRQKKSFKTLLPRTIVLDDDFLYFFGLWVGDKASGGRIGVMNKNKGLNLCTADYLKKLHQKSEFVLYIHKNVKMPVLDYKIDKVIRIKSEINGYAISVHAVNGILKSFFDYLDKHLDEFLKLIDKKNIFFAGLFDAEGNVCLETNRLRWSCKNKRNIDIFSRHLKELGLFHRFDGCNLVTNNKDVFKRDILLYLKSFDKVNIANLLCFGKGVLPERFKNVLRFILENSGERYPSIAKALKKNSVFSIITFLERNGYVKKEGYPHRIYITDKGVASLSHGGKDK